MHSAPTTNTSAAAFHFRQPPHEAAPHPEVDNGLMIGRVLQNRYLTEELLDESSVSTRYRAYDMATDETVTVEVLPQHALAAWPERRRAITRLAAHGHPHVASVLGHGILAGSRPFLVFELAGARTLAQLQSIGAPPDLRHALHIAVACAEALTALHASGVIHGRFSPEHVRVSSAGSERERVKVDGFGLAPLIDQPTQARDVATDVQRLGGVLHALVSPRLALAAANDGPDDLPRRIFQKIVARCLAGQRERRYPAAAQVVSDLRRLEAALERRDKERRGAREPTSPARVPATIHALRARARVAMPPALAKVIVRLGA